MSKLDTVYDDYILKNNILWGAVGYNPTKHFCLTKEEFIESVLNDDDFHNNWGKEISEPLSEEEIAANPNGPKRKLIEE